MLRKAILVLLALLSLSSVAVQAQNLVYRPTCVAYYPATSSYYVTNQTGGTYGGIVKIDSTGAQTWFNHSLSTLTGDFIMGDTLVVESGPVVTFLSLTDGSVLKTVLISGASRLYSIASDGAGHLFLSDYNTNCVYKLNLSTWKSTTFVSGMTKACGLLYQFSHNRLLLISGAENSIISAINPDDSTVTQLVGVGVGDLDRFSEDDEGNLYVSDWTQDVVFRFDADFSSAPVIVARGFQDPSGICINKSRKIMVVPNTTQNSVAFVELPIGLFNRVWSGPGADGGASSDAQGASWADVNGDGQEDLFIANGETSVPLPNNLYLNDGDGTFTKVTSGALVTDSGTSLASAWADYDNDGALDCFVAEGAGKGALYHNNGSGTMTKVASGPVAADTGYSEGAAWSDYDKDGLLDLFVSHWSSNSLFRNQGASFAKVTTGSIATDVGQAMGASWADYDSDDDPDLFVPLASGAVADPDDRLYRNSGGLFARVLDQPIDSDGVATFGGSWGDYDNDGDLDLFVPAGTVSVGLLYSNNGNGTFSKVTGNGLVTTGGDYIGSCWADYNNDGFLDLFVANSDASTGEIGNAVFVNNGDGSFTAVSHGQIVTDSAHSSGVAAADYDSDGDVDVMFPQSDGYSGLLYRNNDSAQSWIEIKCVGSKANRSAIGVKVRVKATIGGTPMWQLREISTQTGFHSENSLIVHFGLGDATVIDTLRCEWPGGCTSVLAHVLPKQILTIEEMVNQSCCCVGATGNVNGMGIVDLSDLSCLVSYLTGGGYVLPCTKEANVNSIGIVDLSDLSCLVSYLTGGGYTLPTCP